MHRLLLLFLGAATGLACFAAQGLAQKNDKKEAWRLDPYTKGEPKAMQRAGYVSFGPLPWGDDHDTRKIDAMMPEAKILWVETAHFRIGSSLETLPMPKSSTARRRVKAELTALKKKLPTVKPAARELDRWLRLHLYAFRLENLYADWLKMLRVTDASFPKQVPATPKPGDSEYMGRGPYLGMGDKYSILLFQKASNLTRYSIKNGQPQPKDPRPIAINFLERGSMLFGTCTEIVFHTYDPDHRLHAHIIFNVSQLLVRGYRYYGHVLPAWFEEGVANSFVIEWDPTQHDFSGMKDWDHTKAYPKKWAVNCRRLAKNGFAAESKRLCTTPDSGSLTFNDQMCTWSRVDFLRKIDGGAKFAEFVKLLKAPMPHEPEKNPTFATVLAAQESALRKVYGMGFDEFDAAWKAYVLAEYPKR